MSEERILNKKLLRRIEDLEKEIAKRDAIIAAQALKIKELKEKRNYSVKHLVSNQGIKPLYIVV